MANAAKQHEGTLLGKGLTAWQEWVEQQRHVDQQVTAAANDVMWQLWKSKGPRVLRAWRATANALQEQRSKVAGFSWVPECSSNVDVGFKLILDNG